MSHLSSIEEVLRNHEDRRESAWRTRERAMSTKLRWRATRVQHCFHVLPGEHILELGAGSGLWTTQLARALRFENPITAAVFSPERIPDALSGDIQGATFVPVTSLASDFAPESFNYIVGSSMLWNQHLPEVLAILYRLLKPGGQILFFEPNLRFPGRRAWNHIKAVTRGDGNGAFTASAARVAHLCSHQGFTHVDLTPYDILPAALGRRGLAALQAKTLLLEHAPVVQTFCTSMFLWARKPGFEPRRLPHLAHHRDLHRSVSVVLPCRNEAPNLPRIVDGLLTCYDDYIHEILLVNDSSSDNTAEVGAQIGRVAPRVKVINRVEPNGVGLALKDGYKAATGRYILSMDCDFVEILPDLRALFDVIAAGKDGAIGSRFSHDSILVNYPFRKLLLNRAVHVLIKLLLPNVRDLTNNLKLYRAEIFQNLIIESPHFSANLETGLKPLLAGYAIEEVPISWINRTVGMGSSSFHVRKVGFAYARALFRIWNTRRVGGARSFFKSDDTLPPAHRPQHVLTESK